MKLTIATRGSKLAIWQAEHIKDRLNNHYDDLEVDFDVIKTKGDKILDTPLAKIGGKGLFTKELEVAMLNDEAQLAVHSLKDVPVEFPEGLKLSVITKREDPRDAFVSFNYKTIDDLPKNAVVGTTSLRRRMQLLTYRDDLVIKNLRGNVNTRLRKLKDGEFDAIILATAGIVRLGLDKEVDFVTPIDKNIMIPAMGQAALGIEIVDKSDVEAKIDFLNDNNAVIETTIERDFVQSLEGGCQVPIGINAELQEDKILVRAIIGLPDGTNIIKKTNTISIDRYKTYGKELAEEFIKNGAREILKKAEYMAMNVIFENN